MSRRKVYPPCRKVRNPFEIGGKEEAVLNQKIGADQQWIAGESGNTAVWGIIVDGIRGVEGQDLPVPLPARRQKIDKRRASGPDRQFQREKAKTSNEAGSRILFFQA